MDKMKIPNLSWGGARWLVPGLFAAVSAAPVLGQEQPLPITYQKARAEYQKMFRRADVDQDYRLSHHEAEERLPRLLDDFSNLDADDDGHISQEEYINYVKGRYRKVVRAKAQ